MSTVLILEQQKLRDTILNINKSSYNYGLADFEKLNAAGVSQLEANSFIELTTKFNLVFLLF